MQTIFLHTLMSNTPSPPSLYAFQNMSSHFSSSSSFDKNVGVHCVPGYLFSERFIINTLLYLGLSSTEFKSKTILQKILNIKFYISIELIVHPSSVSGEPRDVYLVPAVLQSGGWLW